MLDSVYDYESVIVKLWLLMDMSRDIIPSQQITNQEHLYCCIPLMRISIIGLQRVIVFLWFHFEILKQLSCPIISYKNLPSNLKTIWSYFILPGSFILFHVYWFLWVIPKDTKATKASPTSMDSSPSRRVSGKLV